MNRASQDHPNSEESGQATRRAALMAVCLGVLVVLGWIYPGGAYPLQSLALHCGLWALALGLTAWHACVGRECRAPRAAVFAALGLALWAFARWRAMEITAPGREYVLGLLWLGIAATAGFGLGAIERAAGDGREPACAALRRLWVVAAIGLGLFALYQYFISYPASWLELSTANPGPPTDLQTESLLHALRERRVSGRWGNPNLFAAHLSVLAVFCLATLAPRGEPRAWRVIGAAGWLAATSGVALTASRGGLLTFGIATLGGMLLWVLQGRGEAARGTHDAARVPVENPKFPAAGLGFGIALLASRAEASGLGGLAARLGRIDTIRERLYYWSIALRVWSEHWIIGAGPGSFATFYIAFKPDQARESQYAHSWVMQAGSELGVIGLALFAAFWWAGGVAPLVRGARRRGGAAVGERPWIALAVVVLAFNGLFEYTLQWREFLVLAGLMAGLASASAMEPAPAAAAGPRAWAARAALALAVSVSALAAWLTPAWHLAGHWGWMARDLIEAGEVREGIEALERQSAWLPDDASLKISLAGMVAAHNPTRAWTLLNQAERLNPRSAAVPSAKAEWLEAQGRRPEALEALGEAIARYPSKVDYRMRRARLLLDLGRTEEARKDLEFIREKNLLIYLYEAPRLDALRARAALPPR